MIAVHSVISRTMVKPSRGAWVIAFAGSRCRSHRYISSEWCRCYETAKLAFGTYKLWPPLNSFFEDYSTRDEQTQAVLKQIESFAEEGNLVLVTHQVNITALTGKAVSQGEAVVVRHDSERGFQVLGNIRFE